MNVYEITEEMLTLDVLKFKTDNDEISFIRKEKTLKLIAKCIKRYVDKGYLSVTEGHEAEFEKYFKENKLV